MIRKKACGGCAFGIAVGFIVLVILLAGGASANPLAQLYVSISESPDPVVSGGTSRVTVHVVRPCGSEPGDFCILIYPPPLIPASNVSVNVSATGGSLNPNNGITDSKGNFTANYNASTAGTYLISATASKPGYVAGHGNDSINVTPSLMKPMLSVSASPMMIKVNRSVNITFKVTSIGKPVDNATVTLTGAGVNAIAATNSTGYAVIRVNATSKGQIKVSARKDGYNGAAGTVMVILLP